MGITEKKKGKQVVRDMKNCFRSFKLPVSQLKAFQDSPTNVVFPSEICNDHVCAGAAAIFDGAIGYAGIDISFHSKVPSEKMAEISQLLNLLNEARSFGGYSVCHCCNTVSLRAGLYITETILSKDRFNLLIRERLGNTYLFAPLIEEVAKDGNPEVLYDRFMDDHRDQMSKSGHFSEEAVRKILVDMESVMTGLKISIHEDEKITDCFIMTRTIDGMDFPVHIGAAVDDEDEIVNLSMASPFTVPEEQMPMMTELVNRINRMLGVDHLFIHRKNKRVFLVKGILIGSNGVLDPKEFETAIRSLLCCGPFFFPAINEQLSSNEYLEVLIAKVKAKYNDSRQESK